MRKETDLAKIKAVAHTFLVMDIQPTAHAPVVVSHPFTNSGFVGVRDVEGNLAIADLLNKPEDCCLWREQIGQYIDQADSAYQVFLLLNKPYTGRTLALHEIHCHHKRPKSAGGTDAYANLVIVSETVHQLVHATDEKTIYRLLQTLRLDDQQRNKLNKLRKQANLNAI